MDSWKIIMRAGSAAPFEVYLAKSYLEANGIEVQLQNELAAQVYSGAVDEAKLLVRESDVEQGIKLLTEGGYIQI
ncbi:MAG TPA: DUF2007 domain-containing protein [Agriterribacter sp.]|nr:DUF2007 domain-containing protein [Agriterribacter sp.]HRQ50468.1 DUF2007 domain-containing protein [Agriterribacter sp.]